MEDVAGIEADGPRVMVTSFDVQMINLNFDAGMHLYLQGLCDACVSRGLVASYDSDVYPGLNVKLVADGQRVTVLLFRSGKVIMTGAKSAAQLYEAHLAITDVLDSYEAPPA